ncbi:extracellular solute-binding protein [Bacillus infantis]|uniref:extracellular solute-binding protein n=1 Tax=Bacillus infantis TaxID=324767 RepID=UPI0013EE147A|nr:extracellular solute-binding protein [Bacillus infantis]
MYRKGRYFSIIFMVFIIIFTTACTKKEEVGKVKEVGKDDTLVIQYLTRPNSANIKRSDETPIGKVIKEKFNIVIEYIPFSGNYRDKLNMMLAGGDYPGLLRVERQDIIQKYIQAGAALPLDEYLDNAPNFTERYKNTIPYWRVAGNDGKLYKWETKVPQDIKNFCECFDIAVRSDVLEEQGWPSLVSTDDYIEALKKAMKDHPETNGKKTVGVVVPFAESYGMAGIAPILYEKGENIISIGNEGVLFDMKNDRFDHMLTNPNTKASYKFFNDLYREGLLDEESFTDTMDQVQEKISAGRALAVYYTMWVIGSTNRQLESAGTPELQYVQLPIQSAEQVANGEKRALRLESTRPYDSVVITKNAEQPERIVELLDWIASEEGQLLTQSGVEGVHYTVEDGKRVPTKEYVDGLQADSAYLASQGFGLFDMFGTVNVSSEEDGQPYNLLNDVNIADDIYNTDRINESYEKLGWEHSKDWWYENGKPTPAGVASAMMIEPSSELGMVHQKMTELRVRSTPDLIMADSDAEFEKVWADIEKQYEKLDPQRVVDSFNEMYQESKKEVEQYQ